MQMIQVPETINAQNGIHAEAISFLNYQDTGGLFRNRVVFNCFAFSFILNGRKHIYRDGGQTTLQPKQGMLIPAGHSLIAEHSDNTEPYQSFLIFFPIETGRNFMKANLKREQIRSRNIPYLHFEVDNYIKSYVDQIRNLIGSGVQLSESVAVHKLNELLLYLSEHYPDELTHLFSNEQQTNLKQLVEQQLFNKLSLDELAFLAHRSLASFKRDFEKLYGIAPQRYIRQRKLELAAADLARGKSPTALYLHYGYQSLSSFCSVFKRAYGCSPASWQNELTET